ncbi:MAG TPA: 16S rRNA (cytosine(967)-C(5))-methyltransferase RsmB [Caldimonas sp.]|nr:16S rRNA (cytosine(967)-C(5))-methyltransferase RsmB [Caldimonas sp.]
MATRTNATPPAPQGLPLALLLGTTADAVQAVRAGASLNDALARTPLAARPGTQALAFRVLRRLGSAQWARRKLAFRTPPPAIEAMLLTGLALLWPEGEMPYAPHTVVDQAVTAMNARAPRNAAFVNAVLRRFLREQAAIVAEAERDATARWNHPAWWIERLRVDWPGDWEAILAADNLRPPMTLRVNARRTTAQAYVERLARAGVAARALEAPAQAVQLDAPMPVDALPGFRDGDVSVQDANAQLAAPLLAARLGRGARVLDACAAPGGKTAHLLELGDFDVLAVDRDAARLARVDAALSRLGLTARTLAADAAEPAAWWDGTAYDAILLDAPCSASGIVRRHPDIRWLRRATDIEAFAAQQDRLLHALWPLLAPGGRLLYCTCSVFRDEGERRIDAFLQREPAASLAASPPSPGHLLPLADNHRDGAPSAGEGFSTAADGFFHALIQQRPRD